MIIQRNVSRTVKFKGSISNKELIPETSEIGPVLPLGVSPEFSPVKLRFSRVVICPFAKRRVVKIAV